MNALYTLLPFILVKDLGATTFQLAIFIALRPVLTFFSFYWGFFFKKDLLKNVRLSCIFAYLPFCIFAFVENVWVLLLSSAFFQMFHRAGIPAWIEVIKRNLPITTREKAFSSSFALSFIVSGLFGLGIGTLLDANSHAFKFLLWMISLVGLGSVFFLSAVPRPNNQELPSFSCFKILSERRDFRFFQMIFMIGGATLMMLAPALSVYYVKVLSLSHLDISLARFVFMSFGVFISTYFWNRIFQNYHINVVIIPILFGFGLFPFFLLFAKLNLIILYLAFFIYGIAQAGSHLVWNLSGISFSNEDSSVPFSQINLLMIGMRGLIFPFLGSLLCTGLGSVWVLVLGMVLCFLGVIYAEGSRYWSRAKRS